MSEEVEKPKDNEEAVEAAPDKSAEEANAESPPAESSGDGQSEDAVEASSESSSEDDDSSGEISLDDIDAILSEAAPEFEAEMQELQDAGEEFDGEIEDLEAEEVPLTFEEKYPRLNKIITPVKNFFGRFAFIARIFGGLFSFIKRTFGSAAFYSRRAFWFTYDFLKVNVPIAIRFVLTNLKDFIGYTTSQVKSFMALPLKIKLLALCGCIMLGVTAMLAKNTLEGIWMPILKDKPVMSFDEVADNVYKIDVASKLVFYNTVFPQPEYTMLLKHMVVSLKREAFESTPMAAYQFYLNLDSQDTAIEVKDREPQILDAIQRIIERKTYTELNSYNGTKGIKSSIRKEINSMLNFGKVREVYIKTKVLKP